MKTPRHEIAAVLAKQTLAPGFKASDMSRSVAAYLLESGRTGELESLLRDVIEVRARHGVVEVVAVSAYKLSDSVKADIKREVRKRYPDAKQIIITEQIDEDIVAGVRLEFPGEQLDLSVRNTLNRFKQLTSAGESSRG
jgi:F0F1-type ATP synthase delta subunit